MAALCAQVSGRRGSKPLADMPAVRMHIHQPAYPPPPLPHSPTTRTHAHVTPQVARLHRQRASFRASGRDAAEALARVQGVLDSIDSDFAVVGAVVEELVNGVEGAAAACGLPALLGPLGMLALGRAGGGKVSDQLRAVWQAVQALSGELLALYRWAGRGLDGGGLNGRFLCDWSDPAILGLALVALLTSQELVSGLAGSFTLKLIFGAAVAGGHLLRPHCCCAGRGHLRRALRSRGMRRWRSTGRR